MGLFRKRKVLTCFDLAAEFGPRMDIVGESKYPESFTFLVGEQGLNAVGGTEKFVTGVFIREPKNPYDSNAVRVDAGAHTVGYIPRADAIVLARMMDATKTKAIGVKLRVWARYDGPRVIGSARVMLHDFA